MGMLLGLTTLLSFSQPLRAAEVIPSRPQGNYINDYAHVLSNPTVSDLNRKLNDFEKQTSNQVLVVIYPKMQSDSSIDDYAVRVAHAWGVGRKDRANGIVLFIFTQDRKMTIQVGYGLEGPLPDALAKDIIEDVIKPHFRNNDYDGGVRAGVDAIMKATKGEYKGTGRSAASSQRPHWIGPLLTVVAILLIIRAIRRRTQGAIYGPAGVYRRRFGGGFWPGYYIGGGFGRGGGWGGGGGSWGGGGGGGGGFSAGGGSFGGGGASGSW
jgi:uncharacterized protein